jgi:hypothetical protein
VSPGTTDDGGNKDWIEGLPSSATRSPSPLATIDPAKLPYPLPEGLDPISTIRPLRALDPVRFQGALSAGKTSVTRSTLGPPQEGILAFFQDRFVLFLLDGGQWSVNYDALANFKLKRLLRFPEFRKLTLRGKDGSKMTFYPMGLEAAANAGYILAEKGVPSG